MSRFSSTTFPAASGDVMLEVTQRRLDAQHDSFESYDAKAGIALAVASGLVGVLFAVVATNPSRLHTVGLLTLGLTTAVFAAQVLASYLALKFQPWGVGLEPDEVLELYGDKSVEEHDRVWIVAEGYAKAFNENEPRLGSKRWRAAASLYLLVVETIVLITCLAAFSGQA